MRMLLLVLASVLTLHAPKAQAALHASYVCLSSDTAPAPHAKRNVYTGFKLVSRAGEAQAKSAASALALQSCRHKSSHPRACIAPKCERFVGIAGISGGRAVPEQVPRGRGNQAEDDGESSSGGGGISTPAPTPEPPVHRQCDSNSDCHGFANSCFAGKCTAEGHLCESNNDCHGFANSCFAGKCTSQEALCDTNKDCPGFANSCFAGKCTNP